jgi:hypothetical protein
VFTPLTAVMLLAFLVATLATDSAADRDLLILVDLRVGCGGRRRLPPGPSASPDGDQPRTGDAGAGA